MGELIEFSSDNKQVTGYLAIPPQGRGRAVLLMHAWWGLNDFFKDLADRLAAEGFVVLAPDLYEGVTASTIEEAENASKGLDYKEAIKWETAAAEHLLKHPAVQGNQLGEIGFSMGAAYAVWLATLRPEVAAVVLFYGGADSGDWLGEDFAEKTKAAFLGHFAENDPYEPGEMVPKLEDQLRSAGRDAAIYVYPDTGHWFFENDRPDAYDPDASRLAWQRTVQFLQDKLD